MAVTDLAWWGVWWPWMLVWGSTIVSMGAAAMITIAHRRTHRRTTEPPDHGSTVYLDDEAVMELYHREYSAAVSQEIEKTINRNREGELSADLARVRAGGRRGMNETVVSRFIETVEPIIAIGRVIDALNKADRIVYVDLRKREVTSNHALIKILDRAHDKRPKAIPPRSLTGSVSVSGLFRQTGQTISTTILQAPYGDPTDTTEGPQVHVKCDKSKLRGRTIPTGFFEARCLGRVQWDPQRRCLVLDPIAIFLL
jgi:hypothetical protein